MKDYSSDPLLRLMKNAPAAPAITTTPMIVKRYVPIPPVDGRDPSLVSFILVVCVRTEKLRGFLEKKFNTIHILSFEERMFPEIEQEACLEIGRAHV